MLRIATRSMKRTSALVVAVSIGDLSRDQCRFRKFADDIVCLTESAERTP